MPKTGKNRLHFDLAPPLNGDQQAEVDRLDFLGADSNRHRPGRGQLDGDGRSGRKGTASAPQPSGVVLEASHDVHPRVVVELGQRSHDLEDRPRAAGREASRLVLPAVEFKRNPRTSQPQPTQHNRPIPLPTQRSQQRIHLARGEMRGSVRVVRTSGTPCRGRCRSRLVGKPPRHRICPRHHPGRAGKRTTRTRSTDDTAPTAPSHPRHHRRRSHYSSAGSDLATAWKGFERCRYCHSKRLRCCQ